ncbi:MAG: S-methyl-5-thioribose-1-phosphate isomerase [Candidatus Omnitrophica bacterium 4484_70.1]|nr:MAG: S-methyl-5-thioribose-1-phosphate isomerase [Candidatus Omnitrophica bacterium 4484_70.1]
MISSVVFKKGSLYYLDQTKLPSEKIWRKCNSLGEAYSAICNLKIRGAPLIGVFAAYAVWIGIRKIPENISKDKFLKYTQKVMEYLKSSRPTAVNLFFSLERIEKVLRENKEKSVKKLKELVLKEAKRIHNEDKKMCERIAHLGISLIKKGDRILTYCNTGILATAGEGTALGIIYKAKRVYKDIKVFACETRPLLQGARLTCWELLERRIKVTLICDNMVGYLMQKGMIDEVIVGADRITRCGDVANKIGTYNLAVLAFHHKIPFYVAAPLSSFDLRLDKGEKIPIEERDEKEVRTISGRIIAPYNVAVFNPAFDITPSRFITAIITDKGIIRPPFEENIKKLYE